MEKSQKWTEFINKAYIEFRGDTRKTISDFADWLDLPQGQLSQYMRTGGKVPRSQSVVGKFVKRYGNTIYDVLGFPVPGDPLHLMPEPLRSISLEIRDTLMAKQIPADSPEAGVVMDEILKKHGFDLIEIRDEPLA